MAETATLTLTDFLLARVAEDEDAARSAYPSGKWRIDTSKRQLAIAGTIAAQDVPWRFARLSEGCTAQFIVRNDPVRVLAECEAKRRVVEAFSNEGPWRAHRAAERAQEVWVLTALAFPYADHPDYREEWRP